MMSVQSYIDHAKKQMAFVESKRHTYYYWGTAECKEIVNSFHLALLNICKAVLVQNNIDFSGRNDNEIISFVSTNRSYCKYIDLFNTNYSYWEHATRRRDRNSRSYNLAGSLTCLEDFIKYLNYESKSGIKRCFR